MVDRYFSSQIKNFSNIKRIIEGFITKSDLKILTTKAQIKELSAFLNHKNLTLNIKNSKSYFDRNQEIVLEYFQERLCNEEKDKFDLALILLPESSQTTVLFTTNKFYAESIKISKHNITANQGKVRAILVNSGNANCGLGKRGIEDIAIMHEIISSKLRIADIDILNFSTGVISCPLPIKHMLNKLEYILDKQTNSQIQQQNSFAMVDNFAEAILTTDTKKKFAAREIVINSKNIQIWGVAKGSGMIKPNMATMLAYLFSNINLDLQTQQQALQAAVTQSFNAISVDGDTSTNDAVILSAMNIATEPRYTIGSKEFVLFQEALNQVCKDLAKQIILDAEGANKFVELEVKNYLDFNEDAQKIFLALANSPLSRIAMYAEDANWGRILAAIGRSGSSNLDIEKLCLSIEDSDSTQVLYQNGARVLDYNEENATKIMRSAKIKIIADLNLRGQDKSNQNSHSFFICDLSHAYININSSYRS